MVSHIWPTWPGIQLISDIGMSSDVGIRTLPLSEWRFSVRHICLRYRNNRCLCRMSDIADIEIDVDAHLWWLPVHDANLTPHGPLLRIICPVSHKLLVAHPSPSPLPFQPHMPTHMTQFLLWKMTSARQNPSSSRTGSTHEFLEHFANEKVLLISGLGRWD